MRIRQYVDSDLAEVVSSWESATRLAHPFMTEEFLAQERKNLPELYLPNADTWVAEIDGVKCIGTYHINRLVVRKQTECFL